MSSITTSFSGEAYKPKPKGFSWSYSRLKNFETCPKRHYNVDIAKYYKQEEGEDLQWGGAVHKAMANRCGRGHAALPLPMAGFEKWAARIVTPPGNVFVEQQLAIDENFAATKWFDKDAERAGTGKPWFRAVVDVLKINGPVALAIDWKTGKIIEDAPQLALAAACVFAHHPKVMKIRSEFVWLKEDASTRQDFKRDEMAAMWRNMWPRIEALKVAHETQNYPAKPGYLCRRFCPVTSCPHHGQ
jgi:PD-(D/E)XK nuclease superfamily